MGGVVANFPAFRLVGKSESWKVGELGSWRGAEVRAQEQKDRGGAAMQKRTDARSGIPEKRGWAHPPPSFPHEGEKKKGECTHP